MGTKYYGIDPTSPPSFSYPTLNDHTGAGQVAREQVGENVVFGEILYIKNDSKWWKTDARDVAKLPGMRMALETIAADGVGQLLTLGVARDDSWNWSTGLIYAALGDTPATGAMTQTPPTGVYPEGVQIVGYALSPDVMMFQPSYFVFDAINIVGGEAGKTLTVNKTMTLSCADDTAVVTFPTGSTTLLYSGGALGTPASGTLTNCTFPTLNQNTSGSSATCTGNAGTATKLETARTIGGVSFDGSANITVESATNGFTVTGALTATGNITAYYSDMRLKTKVGKIKNALDKVCSLEGFFYKANKIAKKLGYKPVKDVGLSAQDVLEVLPEAIAPAPIDPQYMTIRYEKIIPLLVEAIKELRAEVDVLRSKNA